MGPHPLTRLVALAATVQMALLVDHPAAVAPLLLLVIGAAAWSGAGRALLRLWGLLLGLPLLSVLLWTAAFPVRGRWSAGSALFGLGMGLRLETMLVAGVMFVVTTRPEEINYALRVLRVPYRIAFAFTLAVRLFPLFAASTRTIVLAQRARGITFGAGGRLGRTRRYIPLLVPIMASGLRQADRLSIALEARGFGREHPRTSYLQHRFGAADLLMGAALLVVEASVLWLRLSGRGTVF